MASIAEFYSQNLVNELMKGLRQKALKAEPAGRAPLGYLNQRQLVEGREIRYVALDPARAEHVTWAFKAYASGKWSLNEIAAELGRRGDDQARPEHTGEAAESRRSRRPKRFEP